MTDTRFKFGIWMKARKVVYQCENALDRIQFQIKANQQALIEDHRAMTKKVWSWSQFKFIEVPRFSSDEEMMEYLSVRDDEWFMSALDNTSYWYRDKIKDLESLYDVAYRHPPDHEIFISDQLLTLL